MEKDLLIRLANESLPKKERRRNSRKKYNRSARREKAIVRKKQEKSESRRIKAEIVEYQRNGRRVFLNNTIKKENGKQQENPVPVVSELSKKTSTWTLFRFPLTLWKRWKNFLN